MAVTDFLVNSLIDQNIGLVVDLMVSSLCSIGLILQNVSSELPNLINYSDMLPPSTKQLMQQSVPFKFTFITAILLMVTIIVLGMVSANVICQEYYQYRSCSEASYYYYYQCNSGETYCCSSQNYQYCGNSYYCKPLSSFSYFRLTPCMGIFITMWVCSPLCFFLSIISFVLFRNLRRKALQDYQIFSTANHFGSVSGYVPPVVFPNQNQPPVLRVNQTEYTEYNRRLVE